MSHNTFGDVDTRPHHTEFYDPNPELLPPDAGGARPDVDDPLAQAEAEADGIDLITHELTDSRHDIFGETEDKSEYQYSDELGKVASTAANSLHREGILDNNEDKDAEEE